jgi:hypothetical protein
MTDRVLNFDWTGTPTTNPALAVFEEASGSVSAYVSWNGATEVASWELMGAMDQSGSDAVSIHNATKTGFETTMTQELDADYTHFSALARGADGQVLGKSDFVELQ